MGTSACNSSVQVEVCGGLNEKTPLLENHDTRVTKWTRVAWWACLLSIAWNMLEGGFAVYFGVANKQIALLVFGSQSVIEIAAAALVLHRFSLNLDGSDGRDVAKATDVERYGSRSVGVCLILLSIYALAQAVYNLVVHAVPDDSAYGLAVAGVSAVAMFIFWILKHKAADVLQSPVLASDAKCSQMCMSLGLLVVVSSLLFMWLGQRVFWVDAACTIALALKFARDGVLVVQKSYEPDFAGGCACCE